MKALIKHGWTDADARRARGEGWRLGVVHFSGTRISVCRHCQVPSDVSRFGSRQEAEKHVYTKADEGSPLHMKAVACIAKARFNR